MKSPQINSTSRTIRTCVGPLLFSLDAPNEQPCDLPALRDHDMCLYHAAREIVGHLAPEFAILITEPEPVRASRPEILL